MGAEADRQLTERALSAKREDRFPLFLMRLRGEKWYMPLAEAGAAFNASENPAAIVGSVLERNFHVRNITDDERRSIKMAGRIHVVNK